MKISVKDLIGSAFAGYHSEGLKLYALLEKEVVANQPVELSFEGIEACATMFLNASIGKLYTQFPAQTLNALLCYTHTDEIANFNRKKDEVISNALHADFHDAVVEEAILA